MSLQNETRVFRTILWPLIRADLVRVKVYYLGFLPPVLLERLLVRKFRRQDLDKL